MKKQLFLTVFCLSALALAAAEADFSRIKSRISEFTLENGLKFILLEDHSVPIVSFVTYANAGASDERIGIYGISHILEHLAFKGTSEIGSRDYQAEKKVLERMAVAYDRILAEKGQLRPDAAKVEKLQKDLEILNNEASAFIVENEFGTILKANGAVGLNASTSADATVYYYSLPANKIELWAYLESSRFTDPVLREFYKEKDVIMEERRMGVENQPVGKLIEQFLSIAFMNHPYRVETIGPMSNLERISERDVREYLSRNYSARNLVVGVAGDVTPVELKKMAEKYFLKIPAGSKNPRVFTVDPDHGGEKTVTIYEDSQPWLVVGYRVPSVLDPDFDAFTVLNYLLTAGRSSRLNKKLTITDKSALFIGSFAGFPGSKYPSLYLLYTLPNSGHDNSELQKVIFEEIEKLKSEPVSDEELRSAKNRIKVQTYQELKSNQGLLQQLLSAEVLLGSWQKAFDSLASLEKITAADIQKLAQKYLVPQNRSIGRIETKTEVQK
jgi:predicted Zn-dependent peptidase